MRREGPLLGMETNATRTISWPSLALSVFLAAAGRAVLPTAAAVLIGPTVGKMLLSAYGIGLAPATVGAIGSVAAFLMVVYLQESAIPE